MKNIALLVLALAACSKTSSSNAVACDPGAADLATKLAAQDKSLDGKSFAFKNCFFSMQGNDVVSFAAVKDGQDIDCHMKDGEAGVKKFRKAAMDIEDMAKLRLDVRGKVAMLDGRLTMTACTIDTHQ